MDMPLFESGENGGDNDPSDDSDEGEGNRNKKGVRFANDVVDHRRNTKFMKQKTNVSGLVPKKGQGLVAVSMRRTKIGFDQDELK